MVKDGWCLLNGEFEFFKFGLVFFLCFVCVIVYVELFVIIVGYWNFVDGNEWGFVCEVIKLCDCYFVFIKFIGMGINFVLEGFCI